MNDYLSKILKEYNSKVIKKNYVIIVLYCREAEHAALSFTKVLKLALIRALMNNRNLIPSFLSSKVMTALVFTVYTVNSWICYLTEFSIISLKSSKSIFVINRTLTGFCSICRQSITICPRVNPSLSSTVA